MEEFRNKVAALSAGQRKRLAQLLARAMPVRLRGFATLHPGASPPSQSEWREFLAERLPAAAVPSEVHVLESFPRLPNGKLDRRTLAALELQAPPPRDSPAPASGAAATLLAIWEEVLGTDQISVQDNFFEIGGDSILSIQVVSRARSAGLQIAPQDFNENPTIAALAALQDEDQAIQTRPASHAGSLEELGLKHVVPIQTTGPNIPLFCIHSGGDALLYRGLAKQLGPEFPVYGMQPIGLTKDEALPDTIEDIAEPYLREIRAVQKQGPYCLLGNCFGATVGLEIAHRLKADGEEVALLVVVDSAAPNQARPGRAPSIWEAVRERHPGRIWRRLKRNFHAAVTRSAPARTIRRLYIRNLGTPAQHARERFRDLHEAHLEAFYHYDPAPWHGPAVFFQGSDSQTWARDFLGGWAKLAPELDIENFDCKHREFLDDPHVATVAASLRGRIARISAENGYR